MNTKSLITLGISLGVLFVGIIGFVVLQESDNDDASSDNDSNDSSLVTETGDSTIDPFTSGLAGETSMPADDFDFDAAQRQLAVLENTLELITGETTGTAIILDPVFEFNNSTLVIDQETLSFDLDASGFDIAQLGDNSLAIEEDVYPKMQLVLSGILIQDGGDLFAEVDSFAPVFYVEGENGENTPLAGEVSLDILVALQDLGVELPPVSVANPLIIPVTADVDSLQGVTITATEDSEIPFEFREGF